MYKKYVVMMISFVCFSLSTSISFGGVEQRYIGPGGGECVLFARKLVPALPYGLFDFEDKKRIIKSKTPKKGRVAIIDVGNSVGHVAVVVDVDKKGKNKCITIRESNFPRAGIWERKAKASDLSKAEKELRIIGYF